MGETHDVHFSFAGLFYGEGESSLETGILISKEEECLMWSFGFAIFCCCQDDFEAICCSENDWLR
jgi:hypothetical protein